MNSSPDSISPGTLVQTPTGRLATVLSASEGEVTIQWHDDQQLARFREKHLKVIARP